MDGATLSVDKLTTRSPYVDNLYWLGYLTNIYGTSHDETYDMDEVEMESERSYYVPLLIIQIVVWLLTLCCPAFATSMV